MTTTPAPGVTPEMIERIVQAVKPYTTATLFVEELRELVAAALRAQPIPGTVGVRELQWRADWKGGDLPPYFHVGTAGLNSAVVEERWSFGEVKYAYNYRIFVTLAEAKAAAQTDFEALIRSALTQGSQP